MCSEEIRAADGHEFPIKVEQTRAQGTSFTKQTVPGKSGCYFLPGIQLFFALISQVNYLPGIQTMSNDCKLSCGMCDKRDFSFPRDSRCKLK